MNSVKVENKNFNSNSKGLALKTSLITNESEIPKKRVDINVLIARVRSDQRKSKKENLVISGLLLAVLLTVGIIMSI
jgi:hypothetical protein